MPNSLCLDRKLSILLRLACADYRQTSDRSCAKEARELERLSRFLGEVRGRGGPALEQFPRNQANAQRCGPGWRLRSVRYQEQRSQVDILRRLRDGNGYGVGGVDPQRLRERRVEKCLQLLNDCQQSISSKKRLRRPFRLESSTKPIFPGFWNCNAKHIELRKRRKRPNCSSF